MDWAIVAGSLCLGCVIGVLVGWYANSAVLTAGALAACVSAIAGSSVLAMFSFLAGLKGPTHEYWFYPVGLFVGFFAVTAIEIRLYGYSGEKYDSHVANGKKRRR